MFYNNPGDVHVNLKITSDPIMTTAVEGQETHRRTDPPPGENPQYNRQTTVVDTLAPTNTPFVCPHGDTPFYDRNSTMEVISNPTPSTYSTTHQAFVDKNLTADNIAKSNTKIISIFGDVVHQNEGTHLDGIIKYNKEWKYHWRTLNDLPSQR